MPKRTTLKDGPHPVDIHVGGRLRTARLMTGISQEKLGEELGITFQQIQKYEKGMNRLSASKLWGCSQTLGVPVSFFFDGLESGKSEPPSEMQLVNAFAGSQEGIRIVRAFSEIKDPNVRSQFVKMLQAVATSI